MSSRNRLLSEIGLKKAATFHKSLRHIKDNAASKSFNLLKKEADEMLINDDFTLEYIALCDANTLDELNDFDNSKEMRLIGAAFLEGVRLIDNIAL